MSVKNLPQNKGFESYKQSYAQMLCKLYADVVAHPVILKISERHCRFTEILNFRLMAKGLNKTGILRKNKV